MTQPPPDLVQIIEVHLAKVGPHLRPGTPALPNVYSLLIQEARKDAEGNVSAFGNGTLQGPLNVSAPSHRAVLYSIFSSHMPSLRERIESGGAEGQKILIVTCQVTHETIDGKTVTEAHHAVLAVP